MSAFVKPAIIVLLLVIQAVFLAAHVKPIEKIQEVRIAETAREMALSDNWMVPYFNGELRLQKPPLPYWLTALSYRVFGKVDEFSARFASASFALFTVVLLFFWATRSLGLQSALASVIGLITCYIGLRYFRSGEADAILLFFIVAACLLVYRLLFEHANLAHVLLLHLCMGLGFLTKGPAAVAIPMLLLLICAVNYRGFAALRKSLHPLGILVFLLAGSGWYALIFYQFPDQASVFVSGQVDSTFITGNHTKPFYWYALHLPEFFLPWTAFLPLAAVWYWKNRPQARAVEFALLWFGVTFVLLSFIVNKQMQYALLLAPPFMLLLGHYLANSTGRFAAINRILMLVLIVLGLGTLAVFAFNWAAQDDLAWWHYGLLLAGCVLPFGLALAFDLDPARQREILLAGLLASSWIFSQFHFSHVPGGSQEVKQFALAVKNYAPLFIYGSANPQLSFYTGQVVPVIMDAQSLSSRIASGGTAYFIVIGQPPPWPAPLRAARLLSDDELGDDEMGDDELGLWKIENLPQD